MNYLIFSDIHGDFKALETILAMEPYEKICLGDLVTYGDDSEKCVELAKKVMKEKNVKFLKGNWDAIITGETVSNPDFITSKTAENLVVTLNQFYSPKEIDMMFEKNLGLKVLKPFFQQPEDFRNLTKDQLKTELYIKKLEDIPKILASMFPDKEFLKMLKDLPIICDISDLKILLTHGGLSKNEKIFSSTYHEFVNSQEQALTQLNLAQSQGGYTHFIHAHVHVPALMENGQRTTNIKWNTPYNLKDVPYVCLPATGRKVQTAENSPKGYILIEGNGKVKNIIFKQL